VNKLTWTKGLDPKTGLPVEFDPSKDLQTYAEGQLKRGGGDIETCPNLQGGINYWPSAVDPTTGIAYGAGIEGCSNLTNQTIPPNAVKVGQLFQGGAATNADVQTGSVFAYDIATGKQVAKTNLPYPSYAGVSVTPGLVFAGQTDGTFAAYDKKDLSEKWSINVGNSIEAPPSIFTINGKEYVAVMGGPATADLGHADVKAKAPANMLYVFSL
jgi:alcohol dehydrogenase (cytochrome c)